MTADHDFEKLIPTVVGSEPNTVPLSSINVEQLPEMVLAEEEVFGVERGRIVESAALRQRVDYALADLLSEVEIKVTRLRFGITTKPLSFRQIAATEGIPRSTAFDAERRAIYKLSHSRPRRG